MFFQVHELVDWAATKCTKFTQHHLPGMERNVSFETCRIGSFLLENLLSCQNWCSSAHVLEFIVNYFPIERQENLVNIYMQN